MGDPHNRLSSGTLLHFLRPGLVLLVALGLFRIFIGAIGVPESVGTWISSGTVLSLILAVYYGYSAPLHGFRRYWYFIPIGWVISVVESLVVVLGIVVTANFKLANYFTSERVSVQGHIVGHLGSAIGGNMTIPLVVLTGIAFLIGRLRPAVSTMPTEN